LPAAGAADATWRRLRRRSRKVGVFIVGGVVMLSADRKRRAFIVVWALLRRPRGQTTMAEPLAEQRMMPNDSGSMCSLNRFHSTWTADPSACVTDDFIIYGLKET
jgi:hypothetical protein